MQIHTADFVKGVTKDDGILWDGTPQVAFIGRSNVGKSSLINSLTGRKKLVKTSSKPGHTQQINFFSINNKKLYFVDLPGYGFVKQSQQLREQLFELINWYLFTEEHKHKQIVLVLDSKVGLTPDDEEILAAFKEFGKQVIVVANKIDKVKVPQQADVLAALRVQVAPYPVIAYSSPKKIGKQQVLSAIAGN